MTHKEAEAVTEAISAHINEYYKEADRDAAWSWVNLMLTVLTLNNFPLNDVRFPEILRIIANALEVGISTKRKH